MEMLKYWHELSTIKSFKLMVFSNSFIIVIISSY